jgi:hypothetical protein
MTTGQHHPNYEKVARALGATDLDDQAIADHLRSLAGLPGPSEQPSLWTGIVDGLARLADHYPLTEIIPVDLYELQGFTIPWIYGERDPEHPMWEVWRAEIGRPDLDSTGVENVMARFIRELEPKLAGIMKVR